MIFEKIKSPFFRVFFETKNKTIPIVGVVICNLLAALLEGGSFALLLAAFASMSGAILDQKMLGGLAFISLDALIQKNSPQEIAIWFLLAAIVFQLLRSGFSFLGQILTVGLSLNVQEVTQNKVYRQILRLSFSCVSNYKVGDLVDYVRIPISIMFSLIDSANRVLVSLLTIVTLFYFMFHLSLALTIFVVVFFGLIGILQKKIIKKIAVTSKFLADESAGLMKHVVQNFNGIRAIYTFNQQKLSLSKFSFLVSCLTKANKKLNFLNSSVAPLNEFLGIILVGTCLLLGPLILQNNGAPTFSVLLTFLTVAYRLAARIQIFMTGLGSIAYAWGQTARLDEILNDADKEFASEKGIAYRGFNDALRFEQVELKYSTTSSIALRELSLIIPKGQMVAFVGASGAGKSSIIDLLLRLYAPTKGTIYIDNQDLTNYSVGSWREKIGVVSQDAIIFNETIEENIRFGHENKTLIEVKAAAILAGAHAFVQRLPNGYQTVIGERGYRLSGGERQRLSLARVLLKDPEILILDEATSSLDSYSEQVIQKSIEAFRGDKTLIVVAHRLSTISMADNIFVVEHGKIVEEGSHDELLKADGRYAKFWHLQSGNQTCALA